MSHLLDEVVRAQKRGEPAGIASLCTAHPWVLRAALRGDSPVLIEATCNQVNQYGGYSGMTPVNFAGFVRRLAEENGFPEEKLILGGDHLGPSPWQGEIAETAMWQACKLVGAYARAGFTKLHLDASMKLGDDDPDRPLDPGIAARRTAALAKAAETAAGAGKSGLRYVIGNDVPIPGGATAGEVKQHITTEEDARRTLEVTRVEFEKAGLGSAWERVLALVVQPGVEFGDDLVLAYDHEATAGLSRFIKETDLVYEAHSTDYQKEENLRRMVQDGFAILKVGPALTFAFREAAFALEDAEARLVPQEQRSQLAWTLEKVMTRRAQHWEKYYTGTPEEQKFKRKYSLSDRMRYYWQEPDAQKALERLLANLGETPLPGLEGTAREVIMGRIGKVLEVYQRACGGE